MVTFNVSLRQSLALVLSTVGAFIWYYTVIDFWVSPWPLLTTFPAGVLMLLFFDWVIRGYERGWEIRIAKSKREEEQHIQQEKRDVVHLMVLKSLLATDLVTLKRVYETSGGQRYLFEEDIFQECPPGFSPSIAAKYGEIARNNLSDKKIILPVQGEDATWYLNPEYVEFLTRKPGLLVSLLPEEPTKDGL